MITDEVRITFEIEVTKNGKNQNNLFILEFDEDGECSGQAFNPVAGWGNYDNWTDGWSEQDEDINQLIGVISAYSGTMELTDIVGEMQTTDINKPIKREYVHDKETYEIKITCIDIEELQEQ